MNELESIKMQWAQEAQRAFTESREEKFRLAVTEWLNILARWSHVRRTEKRRGTYRQSAPPSL